MPSLVGCPPSKRRRQKTNDLQLFSPRDISSHRWRGERLLSIGRFKYQYQSLSRGRCVVLRQTLYWDFSIGKRTAKVKKEIKKLFAYVFLFIFISLSVTILLTLSFVLKAFLVYLFYFCGWARALDFATRTRACTKI